MSLLRTFLSVVRPFPATATAPTAIMHRAADALPRLSIFRCASGAAERAPRTRRSSKPLPKRKKVEDKGGGGPAFLALPSTDTQRLQVSPFFEPQQQQRQLPAAVILEDDQHPLRYEAISRSTWKVLLRLRAEGHETYLVGGTVRDFLLRKTPKDFDIVTSAEPQEVAMLFRRAFVVGRSFAICLVHEGDDAIEVSSFSTNMDPSSIPLDAAAHAQGLSERMSSTGVKRKKPKKGKRGAAEASNDALFASEGGVESIEFPSSPSPLKGATWASARRENAEKRDFTCNGLLYDPFCRTLYDYVGGVKDCGDRTLRTIGDPQASFSQDPVRILRAIRLAARTGLIMDGPTAAAVASLGPSIAGLPLGRLQMELAAMLAHGSAAASVRLLWRFQLLDIVLPHHASILAKENVARELPAFSLPPASAPLTALLFDLLTRLDRYAVAHKPVESTTWAALLAAPLVVEELQKVLLPNDSGGLIGGGWLSAATLGGGDGELNWYNGATKRAAEAEENEAGEAAHDSDDTDGQGEANQELDAADLAWSEVVDRAITRLLNTAKMAQRRLAAAAALKEGSGGAVPRAASLASCLLPRQAVESARGLFKQEAKLRGQELPDVEESFPKKRGREQVRRRRRRLTPSQFIVLSVLRDSKLWARATASAKEL